MGWSCNADAARTMDKWTQACLQSTGVQNEYISDGTRFFWELSSVEHDDGAITGEILKVLTSRPDGSASCQPIGTFRIDGDGKVAQGPKFLKGAAR